MLLVFFWVTNPSFGTLTEVRNEKIVVAVPLSYFPHNFQSKPKWWCMNQDRLHLKKKTTGQRFRPEYTLEYPNWIIEGKLCVLHLLLTRRHSFTRVMPTVSGIWSPKKHEYNATLPYENQKLSSFFKRKNPQWNFKWQIPKLYLPILLLNIMTLLQSVTMLDL